MHEQTTGSIEAAYIAKVVAGLTLLGCLALAASIPAVSGWSMASTRLFVAALVVASFAAVALLWRRHGRMDELQKWMHQGASVLTLPIAVLGSCVIGILQANGLLPLFNQFWVLGSLVAVWGVCLMLSDRRFR